jgi:hypothetical protein
VEAGGVLMQARPPRDLADAKRAGFVAQHAQDGGAAAAARRGGQAFLACLRCEETLCDHVVILYENYC